MGRWGDGEMGRWGDGEMGRWGDGEIFIKGNYPDMILAYPFTPIPCPIMVHVGWAVHQTDSASWAKPVARHCPPND
ncbi:MAG: hypothetical protein F6J90_13755 [Moorea sp. SIOASIH]|uniref:hypothetical protein n=1 Tax=Moorena sp. SIOASIH TaxID=2607817 RepID=UPI0013B86C2C|nr:hypothetical protein [Moorena sp. SIOASIH]NEO37330.1 hypothetical protein [Moorena sp. SIOASIH]